ncbi:MAG TPA: cytochrome P450 [Gammaproteobacteria bacterium]|nr:cytochrome P450 [Gammaproteobacteria bacterium]
MSAAATLPGPRSRRPAGSMPDFRRDPLGFLEDPVARHGHLCGFRLDHVPCCVVNDPALIRELLVSRTMDLRKPWDVRQLRRYPPAWGVGREASAPLEIAGCHLRRGTQIFMLQYLTQRDARHFENAASFRPARWLGGQRQHPRYACYPFGGGPRVCVGSSFAEPEAGLVLATILQRFGVTPAEPGPPELQPAITLRPRHGLWLRLVDA